jgi:hypothetical protein
MTLLPSAPAIRRYRASFGVDQHLRLVAPFLPFVRAANPAQKMQGAEDLGEPLQVMVERRRLILRSLRLCFLLRLRLLRLNGPWRRPVIALLRLLAPALAAPATLALPPTALLPPKALAVGRNGSKAETDKESGRDSSHEVIKAQRR